MVVREKALSIHPLYDLSRIAPAERTVFLDIETTGLSRARSFIYLIGMVTYEEGCFVSRQYFAEEPSEEVKLLEALYLCLSEKRKKGRVAVVSYNGDAFDIPFIRERARLYFKGADIFDKTASFDLIKKIRPYKKAAGLTSCTLKTVEKLFGIEREDKYGGGELIYVYEEYLRLSRIESGMLEDNRLNHALKERLLETLLLHNAEDIADMPLITGVCAYGELFSGGFELEESAFIHENGSYVWDLKAVLGTPLPKSLYREEGYAVLDISGNPPTCLNLAVSLYEGELKYYFDDYKNYYYLPAEDFAVHKSVGEYVLKSARKQATAATCYQKRQGVFIPQPEEIFTPVFYKDKGKKEKFGELKKIQDGFSSGINKNMAKSYILAVLKDLLL